MSNILRRGRKGSLGRESVLRNITVGVTFIYRGNMYFYLVSARLFRLLTRRLSY